MEPTVQIPKEKIPFKADFIDPLFAIAIHLGFAHGLINSKWFVDWRMPITGERLTAATFALGFLTLVLSWLGYHQSIKSKPLKGYGRFIIDVTLVVIYAMILVKFENLNAVLLLLAIVYLLYLLWDIFKINEYKEQYDLRLSRGKRYHREIVTAIWFGWFLLIWILSNTAIFDYQTLWIFAAIGTVGYRIHKSKFGGKFLWGSAT
jgi:hypothetical protein